MAFLDNSGDIILDAVLTDTGRKRMSNGNFRITKFALGDDEINYELYNKNHASGSAYYDLELLQTPVFEATTGDAAMINHGLVSLTNTNLLYMPTIKRNQLVRNSARPVNNVYYLAKNDSVTAPALITAFGGATGGGREKVLVSADVLSPAIVLETGLDTVEIAPTSFNRTNFITANGLTEGAFSISVDNRFFSAVMGPTLGSTFSNTSDGASTVNFNLNIVTTTTTSEYYKNYNSANINSLNNVVVRRPSDVVSDTLTSVIAGPRASATMIGFQIRLLTADDYSRYGKTGQSIAGAAGTYRYIDTTVRVLGTSGLSEQLPIRIIEKE
tara:strand:- start:4862 stop:5845 length:984 start_codon:yes stop_codon:yes gene_type:complete